MCDEKVKYRGVVASRRYPGLYRAKMKRNRSFALVGYFSDPASAARAYDKAALARDHDALVNFPDERETILAELKVQPIVRDRLEPAITWLDQSEQYRVRFFIAGKLIRDLGVFDKLEDALVRHRAFGTKYLGSKYRAPGATAPVLEPEMPQNSKSEDEGQREATKANTKEYKRSIFINFLRNLRPQKWFKITASELRNEF